MGRVGLWMAVAVMAIVLVSSSITPASADPPEGGSSGNVPPAFVSGIDNMYLPLIPGTTFYYAGTTDGLPQFGIVAVTDDTKEILGVETTVVEDTVWVDDELVEYTLDWYAQDAQGNVWYFGEAAEQYEGGVLVGTEGSWEAGVDGAEAGIVMEADPQKHDVYQQEFYEGVAEDAAEVLNLNRRALGAYRTFRNCLETKEWSPLDPGVVEHKYYAPGVGFVLAVEVKGGKERLELVGITTEE
jgi:hypothetical protein